MEFTGAFTRRFHDLLKVREILNIRLPKSLLDLRSNTNLQMAEILSSHPLGTSQQQLDLILNGDYSKAFHAQDYFSVDDSIAHVFEVIGGNGIMRSNVSGDNLVEIVKVC